MTNANDDAFPTVTDVENVDGEHYLDCWESGLTKREYFACHIAASLNAAAMTSLKHTSKELVAEAAIEAADALIAALNQE